MAETDSRAQVPTRLLIAAAIVTVESLIEIGYVLGNDEYPPLGKIAFAALFGLKIVLAYRMCQLKAGAALGVVVVELAGIQVALSPDLAGGLRLILILGVGAVLVLVLTSLHAFPSPEIR